MVMVHKIGMLKKLVVTPTLPYAQMHSRLGYAFGCNSACIMCMPADMSLLAAYVEMVACLKCNHVVE